MLPLTMGCPRSVVVVSPHIWPDFGDDYPLSRVIAAASGIGRTRWGGSAVVQGTNTWGVGSDLYYSATVTTGATRRLGIGHNPANASGPKVGSIYDQDIEITFQLGATPAGSFVQFWLNGRVSEPTDSFYGLVAQIGTDASITLAIVERVAAAQATLVAAVATGVTFVANTDIKMRLQVFGQGTATIRGKLWLASSPEPATWLVSTTDTSLTSPAGIGLRLFGNTGLTGTATLKFKDWRQRSRIISY